MIGIFDSGLGGLSLVRVVRQRLPDHDILFWGDTAAGPYGHKSAKTVKKLAAQALLKLNSLGAEIILLACATTSSLAYTTLEKTSKTPLLETIAPAVAEAIKVSRKNMLGVMGPPASVKTDVFSRIAQLKSPKAKMYGAACPLLGPLLENRWWKKPEANMIIKKYLHPLKVRQIDTLIMADPAYTLLKRVIQRKAGQRVKLIDVNPTTADHLVSYLDAHPELDEKLPRNKKIRACVTDLTPENRRIAKMFYGANIELEPV
jgi:glutamate racemase